VRLRAKQEQELEKGDAFDENADLDTTHDGSPTFRNMTAEERVRLGQAMEE